MGETMRDYIPQRPQRIGIYDNSTGKVTEAVYSECADQTQSVTIASGTGTYDVTLEFPQTQNSDCDATLGHGVEISYLSGGGATGMTIGDLAKVLTSGTIEITRAGQKCVDQREMAQANFLVQFQAEAALAAGRVAAGWNNEQIYRAGQCTPIMLYTNRDVILVRLRGAQPDETQVVVVKLIFTRYTTQPTTPSCALLPLAIFQGSAFPVKFYESLPTREAQPWDVADLSGANQVATLTHGVQQGLSAERGIA